MTDCASRVDLSPWERKLAEATRLAAEARALREASGGRACPGSRAMAGEADRLLRPLARFARNWSDDEIQALLARMPECASAARLRRWAAAREPGLSL